MIKLLIKGIFWIINTLFTILTYPITAVIFTLFPDLEDLFNSLNQYFDLGLTYVRSVLSMLCITDNMMILLFDYLVICNTIFITIKAYKFAMNIYQRFKP